MKRFDYENSMGYVAYSASKAYQKAFDLELRRKIGITLTQSKVIFALNMQSDLTQKELANRIGIEGPTLVPILDKMEKEGYIKRKADPSDRRVNRIFSTQKTDALWNKMMQCGAQIKKISSDKISDKDSKIALDVFKKITINLEKYIAEVE